MATVTHIILQNTWTEVAYHLDICHVTRNPKCTGLGNETGKLQNIKKIDT